jgi:hypothetical protein
MDWPRDGELSPDQTGHPVLWHAYLKELGYHIQLPKLSARWFADFWGDQKESRRLKSFGYQTGKDSTTPHFLCTRGGYQMHTDPGFTRYALQLQLYNDGFLLCGLKDRPAEMPVFFPGLVILLDTWSPHQVIRDPRLANEGSNKLLCGIDYSAKPDIHLELPRLIDWVPALLKQRPEQADLNLAVG